jgi:anthranilate synthase component 1
MHQNIIAINHFQNEAYIFCHSLDGKNNISDRAITTRNITSYKFFKEG